MSGLCPLDGFFGPSVGPACRGGFDFTLTFEQSMFGLLPASLLLLCSPARISVLVRGRKVTRRSFISTIKLVSASLLVFSDILLAVFWGYFQGFRVSISITAACVELIGSFMILGLSYLEHVRTVRPSSFLQLYLLFTLSFNALSLRTLFLIAVPLPLLSFSIANLAFRALSLVLESTSKRHLITSELDYCRSPEDTIGLFDRRLFWWINGLFRTGYHRVLHSYDLFALDRDLTAASVGKTLSDGLRSKSGKRIDSTLFLNALGCFKTDILASVIPKILYLGVTFAQPFIIRQLIDLVQTPRSPSSNRRGYGLTGATALTYISMAILSSWYWQTVTRFNTKLRGCLIAAIYDKTLEMDPFQQVQDSAVMLMNVDVEKVLKGTRILHEFWATTLSVAIALYLLYLQVGLPFLAPLLIAILLAWICIRVGKYMKPRQLLFLAATQRRVDFFALLVSGLKAGKMLGLSQALENIATHLRVEEVEAQRGVRKVLLWVLSISQFIFQSSSLALFTTFAIIATFHGDTFDTKRVFTALSILKLVTTPLLETLQYIPLLIGSISSMSRIQDFLYRAEPPKRSSTWPSVGGKRLKLFRKNTSTVVDKEAPCTPIRRLLQQCTESLSSEKKSFSLTLVTGGVGCGKSTFLRALLQAVNSSGTAAFCGQSPWLRYATIRNNIVGASLFETSWYLTVIEACGLLRDFKTLVEGDQTLVGSEGGSLSGGQQKRIALARAIYSRERILILDDVFAGLDSSTETAIFECLFGPCGILRKAGGTTVMSTHSVKWLSKADKIIVLASGKVIKEGNSVEFSADTESLKELGTGILEVSATSQADNVGMFALYNENMKDSYDYAATLLYPGRAGLTQECEVSNLSNKGDYRLYQYYLKAIGWKHTAVFFVLLTCLVVATTFQSLVLKWWADADIPVASSIKRYLPVFVGISILNLLFLVGTMGFSVLYVMPRSSLALHADQLKTLMSASFSHLSKVDNGIIINRFSQDISLVDSQLSSSFLSTSILALTVATNMGILVAATPYIGCIIPFLLALFWVIQRIYLRTSRQLRIIDLEAKAPLCRHFAETLTGIISIRAFGWIEDFRQQSQGLIVKSQVPFYLLATIQNWLALVLDLVAAGLSILLVGLTVKLRGQIDPGYLALALTGLMDLAFLFRELVLDWTMLETSLGAVARIKDFRETTPLEVEPDMSSRVLENWPSTGVIKLENVTAKYPEDSEPVLADINLEIGCGEKIGICGHSGSGKSSLLSLLFGLLEPEEGRILIDETDICTIPPNFCRSKLNSLSQDPFFLPGTVRFNLAPYNSHYISDQRMVEVMRQVGLWDRFDAVGSAKADGQGQGLDAELNAESSLSGGEKQLFCLARAILRKSRILALDEATSSVDPTTEALMQKTIKEEFPTQTIIAVAHRLDTILDYDRVYVLDRGRIVESGNPRSLLAQEESVFKNMYKA